MTIFVCLFAKMNSICMNIIFSISTAKLYTYVCIVYTEKTITLTFTNRIPTKMKIKEMNQRTIKSKIVLKTKNLGRKKKLR